MGSCFGPIFRECHQGPIISTGSVFNPVLSLRLGSAHLLFQTPSTITNRMMFHGEQMKNVTIVEKILR